MVCGPWPWGSRVPEEPWDPKVSHLLSRSSCLSCGRWAVFSEVGSSCSGTFIQQLSRAEMGSPRVSGSVPGQISKLAETYDLSLSSREAMGSGFSDSQVNRTAC